MRGSFKRLPAVLAWTILCAAVTSARANAGTTTYVYDALGRLVGTSNTNSVTTTYQYDLGGNRTYQSIAAQFPSASGTTQTIAINSQSNPINLIDANAVPRYAYATYLQVSNSSGGFSQGVATGHGMVSATGLKITYTPTPGYTGSDSFYYQAVNAVGVSAPAYVSLNIQSGIATWPANWGSTWAH